MDKQNLEEKGRETKNKTSPHISNLIQMCKDNKKIFVILTVFAILIAGTFALIVFSDKKEEIPVTAESSPAGNGTAGGKQVENAIAVPEEALEKDAYPEVNNLVKQYYHALADGDMEAVRGIKSHIEEEEELKIVKKSEFIESYPNIIVHTKKGPVENSYVAYVQYDIKFLDYEQTAPGLNTLYICQDEEGKFFINSGDLEKNIVEYLKTVSSQNDVMDLLNTVQVAYNDVKKENEELGNFLNELPGLLTEAVGEEIARQEAEEAALHPEEETEELAAEIVKTVKTTDVVNVRSSDSVEADKLGKTGKGQVLDLLEERVNGWSKVKFEGKEGYIKTEFLEPYEIETVVNTQNEETEETSGQKETAKNTVQGTLTDNVNVRKEASTEAEKLGKLSVGSTVEIIEKMQNGWTKIKYNGQEAYVKSDYVE